MKSKNYIFRVLWVLAVVTGAALALYFLSKLFILYFSYKVTISVQEHREVPVTFPSVTLCNLNPMANTAISSDDLSLYFELIMPYLTDRNISRQDRFLLANMLEPSTIFENTVQYIQSNNSDDFLVTCRWSSDDFDEDGCIQSARRHIYSTDVGYCLTLDPPINTSYIDGFSAILYIDDSLEVTMPLFELTLARPVSAGALVSVHHTGALPDLTRSAILSVGESTNVELKLTRRLRLPTPYSNCTENDVFAAEVQYEYTQASCVELCFQRHIVEKCGCLYGLLLASEDMQNHSEYCGVLDDNPDDELVGILFLNRTTCVDQILLETALCDDECLTPCREDRYEMTWSGIAWPHAIYQMTFWDTYVRNQSYSSRFQVYEELSHLNTSELYDRVKSETGIIENFLQVIM